MKYIPSSSYAQGGAPSAIPKMVKRKRTFHVFGFIATVMLLGSLASAGGVFFYKQELKKQLDVAKQELLAQSSEDSEKKIDEIGAFHTKLSTARILLDNHLAPSRIFEEIESFTKRTVQFTSFSYAYDPGFEVTIELSGSTDELSSVLLQKMKLLEEAIFSTLVVHSITTSVTSPETSEGETSQEAGEEVVTFGVTGLLKEDVINYKGIRSATSPIVEDARAETAVVSSTTETTVIE